MITETHFLTFKLLIEHLIIWDDESSTKPSFDDSNILHPVIINSCIWMIFYLIVNI